MHISLRSKKGTIFSLGRRDEISVPERSTSRQPGIRRLFVIIGPNRTMGFINSKIMSLLFSNLGELFVEILERILLHVPGQDIIKIESVRKIPAN